MSRATDAILVAAGELFAEHGGQVTIRDIAVQAGLSRAMVMKCSGCKRELFHAVTKVNPRPLPAVPYSELGETLVRELLDRFHAGAIEPLGRTIMLRLTAPDPDSVRESFISGFLDPLAERLGGDDEARLPAELAVGALAGLATTLRIFNAPASSQSGHEVVRRYGAVVQQLLDGCA